MYEPKLYEESPMVCIHDGLVKGRVRWGRKGVKFYSFQGIPYAEPPVGKLRFRAPEPAKPWSGILEATQEAPTCYQRHMIRFEEIEGQEDCLYLNVYTPQISSAYGPYPVMVWIHGGAFVCGSSKTELCGPEFLMTQNVVLVTFNYRVGMLGFMSMDDTFVKVPGNAGLKDQVMVLEWVQHNISRFRGNKHNVTIFGHDAGAASAHLHILSPMSQGLFHKAIMQSGCALNPWVNGVHATGRLLAEELGLHGNDEKMLEKMRQIPVEKIYEAQERLTNDNSVDERWFCSPVVEKQKQKRNPAFLPDDPINIIRSGSYNQVPMVIGYTNREGIYWDIYNRQITGKSELITDFTKVIPNNLNVKKGNLICNTLADMIKHFYWGTQIQKTRMGRDPSLRRMEPLYQLLTDVFFLRGIHSTVKNHLEIAPKVPIYYYRFSFETRLNAFKQMLPPMHRRKYPGAVHGDDLFYLFQTYLTPEIRFGDIEDVAVNKMVRLWTTFAATGEPISSLTYGITWPPVEKNMFHYLDISEEFKAGSFPDHHRMQFWDRLYPNNYYTRYL